MLCSTQQCKAPRRAEEGLPPHQAAHFCRTVQLRHVGKQQGLHRLQAESAVPGQPARGRSRRSGFFFGMQAPWASPAGGSAGSADTAMTTQQGAAAFGWHVTPAPTQTAAPGPLGGGSGAALLSGSRRSRRARRPSTNMQSSLEQEVRRLPGTAIQPFP